MELQTNDYIHFCVGTRKFEGFTQANKALPGDIVDADCKLLQRKKHVLTGVIEFASKAKYGITTRGHPIYLFIPYLKSYPPMIVGSSHKDTANNYIALVEFDNWTASLPRANLLRLIGPCGNSKAEEEGLLLTYHPLSMPKNLEPEIETTHFNERMPCPEETFSIDPEGCMDVDDVLSIETIDGHKMIWVTIADVAERVSSTSAVDDYASKQGQTVYKNGKAIRPMLPYELSENRCSLQEGVLRPGISMIIASTLTRPYKILDVGWSLSCVRNKRQYDYDTFIEKADFDITPIKEIAEDILGYSTDDTHKWVEAYMLKYNLETAKILRQVGHGILRRHAGPEKTKWETYLNWGGESLAVLANAAAEYCGANEPADHVGLGQSAYCHATSPIRRYADLVNQRILKSHINQELISPPHVSIDWLNARQRNGKRYERDIFFLQNLSGQLEGIVLSEKKVWIESWKRLMTWKNTLEPGTHVQLQFFANPNARRWKERIVFRRVEDIL